MLGLLLCDSFAVHNDVIADVSDTFNSIQCFGDSVLKDFTGWQDAKNEAFVTSEATMGGESCHVVAVFTERVHSLKHYILVPIIDSSASDSSAGWVSPNCDMFDRYAAVK